ncbi:uncharacterized protein V1516DRAFT_667897 [Lipomyces oligophaga]|uniref:uncharacterized protein n=1 Tax=Lipomyces oligophaga TaxID=45792 RepID=UPI0034CFB388
MNVDDQPVNSGSSLPNVHWSSVSIHSLDYSSLSSSSGSALHSSQITGSGTPSGPNCSVDVGSSSTSDSFHIYCSSHGSSGPFTWEPTLSAPSNLYNYHLSPYPSELDLSVHIRAFAPLLPKRSSSPVDITPALRPLVRFNHKDNVAFTFRPVYLGDISSIAYNRLRFTAYIVDLCERDSVSSERVMQIPHQLLPRPVLHRYRREQKFRQLRRSTFRVRPERVATNELIPQDITDDENGTLDQDADEDRHSGENSVDSASLMQPGSSRSPSPSSFSHLQIPHVPYDSCLQAPSFIFPVLDLDEERADASWLVTFKNLLSGTLQNVLRLCKSVFPPWVQLNKGINVISLLTLQIVLCFASPWRSWPWLSSAT